MGYYCTVPQCTSLAGKTKNVKFHRFPRDVTMADKWNNILRRGKPYTKYSKVCSLHFTQADYNVTTMGQWKTLSKDAVPSQNLPRLNSDGSVMVIRKSRTVKYREGRTDRSEKEKWALPIGQNTHGGVCVLSEQDANISYRLQALSTIASSLPPSTVKPKKQDAIMQTDPVESKSDDEDSQPDNSYNEGYLAPYSFKSKTEITDKPYQPETKFEDKYEAKDYTKTEDYIPQTNEEYNKEAEKYALERKALNGYDKDGNNGPSSYSKLMDNGYKLPAYPPYPRDFPPAPFAYDELRAQQNLQALQDQQRILENQNMFSDSPIKQEVEINEGDKYMYDRNKEQLECSPLPFQRLPDPLELHVKQEPDVSCDTVMPPQESPYYTNGHSNLPGAYPYEPPRPGPELLIAKQNALAAHTQLWQNSMKRPFFYSESPHYSSPPLLHRYANEDIPRILQ